MSASAWRAVLFAVCAAATIVALAGLFCLTGFGVAPAPLGIKGMTEAASSTPFEELVSAVGPAAPAELAGVRAGDRIELRAMPAGARFGSIGQPLSNRPISLVLRRGAQRLQATFVPVPDANSAIGDWIGAFGAFWLTLFAFFLASRSSEATPELRLLVLTLASAAIWTATDLRYVAAPSAAIYATIAVVHAFAGPAAVAFWAAFSSQVARPPSPARRALRGVCYVLGAIAALVGLAYPVGVLTLWVDPVGVALAPAWTLPQVLQVIAAAACGIVAISAARGAERRRSIWAIASMALIFCIQPVALFGEDVMQSYNGFVTLQAVQNFCTLVAPLGLTYAALSRRLLDVGFVFNRAAVFSGVSLVLFGSFVLVEWALSDWLRDASHTTNVVVGAAIALCLGLSTRVVHTRVDSVVDNVFFRKRHEAERAIRLFAREAPYITDASTLVERAANVIVENADASFVRFALQDGFASYGDAGENDPAIVRLHATHEVLDLHTVDSSMEGDLAYPMVARGRLVGVLVLGPRLSGESYAPDESAAIAQLAHAVGGALDVLAMASGNPQTALLDAIRALPDAIAERIRTSPAT